MTQGTLSEQVAAIQALIGAVDGVRVAPEEPLEQMPTGGVAATINLVSGEFREVTAGRWQAQDTIQIQVLTPLRNMRTDWLRMVDLGQTICRVLVAGDTLGGTALQIDAVRRSLGQFEIGGQQMLAWQLDVDVLSTGDLTEE